MIEMIYILCLIINIKSEVWTITHCLGLGHETMVCAVCLSIFLWIDNYTSFHVYVISSSRHNLKTGIIKRYPRHRHVIIRNDFGCDEVNQDYNDQYNGIVYKAWANI